MPETLTEHPYRSDSTRSRVCVFIDNSNLFHAVRALFPPGSKLQRHRRLDYIKLRDFLGAGAELVDVRFYYSILSQSADCDSEAHRNWCRTKKFIDGISQLGYTMIGLPVSDRVIVTAEGIKHSYKECGLDCEIIYDMASLSRSGRYDSFILVAGDDVYASAVRHLKNETTLRVVVAFFSHVCSTALMTEAPTYIDLGENLELVFRPYRTSDPSAN